MIQEIRELEVWSMGGNLSRFLFYLILNEIFLTSISYVLEAAIGLTHWMRL